MKEYAGRCVSRYHRVCVVLPVWANWWFILCSNFSITLRLTFSLSGPEAWWWSCFTTMIWGVWPWELWPEWADDAVVGWPLSLSVRLWLRLWLAVWSLLLWVLPGLEPVPAAAATDNFLCMFRERKKCVKRNETCMQVHVVMQICRGCRE